MDDQYLHSPIRRYVSLLEMTIFSLEAHLLEKFVVPSFLTNYERENTVNPKHSKFQQRDNSMISWFLAFKCTQIKKCLFGCISACSIKSQLHKVFSSSSTTRIMNLYDRLKVRKLLYQSMRDYLVEI